VHFTAVLRYHDGLLSEHNDKVFSFIPLTDLEDGKRVSFEIYEDALMPGGQFIKILTDLVYRTRPDI
jgi:hypothetical protein